jgi:aminopeptidase N
VNMKFYKIHIAICFVAFFHSAILKSQTDFSSTICKSNCSKHTTAIMRYDFESNKEARDLEGNFDIYYHRLEWQIDPNSLFISGTITTYFKSKVTDMNLLCFDFSDNLIPLQVLYHGSTTTYSIPGDNTIRVDLPVMLAIGEVDSLTISYEGVPIATGFGSFKQGFHTGEPIIYTLSEPYGARDWWPCKQSLEDKIDSLDIFVTTPSQYVVASNGLLMSETIVGVNKIFHWEHHYPIATYLIAVAVTNYDRFVDYIDLPSGDTIEVHNYVYPENLAQWQNMTSSTYAYMRFFSEKFGIYPFSDEKYGHAQFPWGGGMEHQTMSFMGGWSPGLISHELAHQWFGDKITCASWTDIWLNEGFATYLAALAQEEYYPANWEEFKAASIESIVSLPWGSVYVTDTTSAASIFDFRLIYQKGAMVLHMLRWVLGDDDFFEAVRNYLNDPLLAYSFVKTENLVSHLENQSSKDLTEFFEDWFYGEGYPTYTVAVIQNGGFLDITVNQFTSHNSVDFYEMPIPVKAYGDGTDTTYTLNHTFNGQSFMVEVPFIVDSIAFDPDLWLVSGNNEVTFSGNEAFIEVYPNPVGSDLKINSSDPLEEVKIYDSAGRLVGKWKDLGIYAEISMKNMADGIYLIRAKSTSTSVEIKLIHVNE